MTVSLLNLLMPHMHNTHTAFIALSLMHDLQSHAHHYNARAGFPLHAILVCSGSRKIERQIHSSLHHFIYLMLQSMERRSIRNKLLAVELQLDQHLPDNLLLSIGVVSKWPFLHAVPDSEPNLEPDRLQYPLFSRRGGNHHSARITSLINFA